MARKKASPFRTGRASFAKASGGSRFIGLKDGESEVFAPMVNLEDMVSADMHEYWDVFPAAYHPCIGRNCPGCAAGNTPRFKGYLPVEKKDGELAVFPFTISVYNKLEELEDTLLEDSGEGLKGYVLKFARKGSGKTDTRYSVIGLGKRVVIDDAKIPDYVSQLGPQTLDEIKALLDEKGISYEDESDEPIGARPGTVEEVAEEVATATTDDDDWGDF